MFLIFSFLFCNLLALDIPQGLNGSDQQKTMEVLGLSTHSDFLSKAYPLGGYSGLEVSLAVSTFNAQEISSLGNGASPTSEFYFPTLTVGKGIYNNSDIFIHFSPPGKDAEFSKFGASFRWSFYQARFLPINLSVLLHADTVNIQSRISSDNLGSDLMVGLTLNQFSFFLGGGYATSSGEFAGGIDGVTATQKTETRKVESSHFMFGATYDFEPFFIGASINRYTEAVYSVKSGFLF